MQLWNGVVMYAPHTPDHYAIPGMENCIFRLMQKHGDTQAWNLYWLSKPETDALLRARRNWFRHYDSLTPEQTEAFYQALDTPVVGHLTLATIVAQGPREAIRLLGRARLEQTRFYTMMGGETWRQTLLGRLFSAARRDARPVDLSKPLLRADILQMKHQRHASGHKPSGTTG